MPPVQVSPVGRRVVIVADWQGEYGEKGRHLAPLASFTGRNMVRYRSGLLGPRNGVIEVTTSGGSNGVVNGLGYNESANAAGDPEYWFVQGTAVRFMEAGVITNAATALAVNPATAGVPVQGIEKGRLTYITNYNDKLYKLDHSAGTVTAIASPNSPGGSTIVQHRDRTVVAGGGHAPDGTAAPANRVYFSAAGDPENWGTAADGPGGYFDVGHAAGVTCLVGQRDNLVIGTADGRWWIVTGTLGVNHVLREAHRSVSPNAHDHAAALGGGAVGYVIGSSSQGSVQSLGIFTGSNLVPVEDLFFGEGRSGTAPTFHVQPLKEPDDWFVLGGPDNAPNDLAFFRDGIWTLHELGVASVTMRAFCAGRVTDDAWLLTDGGAVGAIPRFFKWRAYNNRPPFTSDAFAEVGDDSDTPLNAYFTLPEVWGQDGEELALRAVTVEFTKWDTGSATANGFTLAVTPTGQHGFGAAGGTGGGEGTASASQSFSEAGASASTSGTRDRRTFYFRDQGFAHGFQLAFTAVRGVGIEKVWLHIDAEPCRVR